MAETAKILAPEKKVLLPDINAGCSLADSCREEDFKKFIIDNPGRTVVSYVNTTAEIKALSDIICTSSNAIQIVESLPENEKIIFGPDRNLGNYVLNKTGRDIIVWNGACHVHEEFSLEAILKLKNEYPEAKLIVHPECELPIRMVADYIGSTSSLLQYSKNDSAKTYIVATEVGIIHQMQKSNSGKKFIPAPPKDSTCGCSECNFMKLITLEKIYNCLKNESPEINVDSEIILKARKPIIRMMEISKKLGL
jgi:quinolinate synthase